MKNYNDIRLLISLFMTLFTVPLISNEDFSATLFEKIDFVEAEYAYNPSVAPDIWEMLKPYFLPENHPIKSKLDKIFSQKRVTANKKSLEKSGFYVRRFKDEKNFAVLFHDKLDDYALKIYTDEAVDDEWFNFLKRITGANIIKDAIARHNYGDLFTVPKKWIYPLPQNPKSTGPHPKNFILVVEKFDIYTGSKNFDKWESSTITKQMLDALYVLLQEEGLNDCIYPFNVPYGKDGRIAFIDTEYYHNWPIYFHKFTKYLSKSNRYYWERLIVQGGPK